MSRETASYELAPGEIEILKSLKYGAGESPKLKSFTELLREAGLSGKALSGYLKKLQKRGFIGRDIDSRKYFSTVKGTIALEYARTADSLIAGEEATKVQVKPLNEGEWVKDLNLVKGDVLTGVEAMDGLPVTFPLREALAMKPSVQEVEFHGEKGWFLAKIIAEEKKPLVLMPGDYVIYRKASDRSIAIVKIKFKIERKGTSKFTALR